jgi:hypothetical protein
LPLLADLPVHELAHLGRGQFDDWYARHLTRIARSMSKLNAQNPRVQPGLKWGHAAKILSLFLRDMVLYTRFLRDTQVRRLSPWLPAPVDGIVIRRLRQLGVRLAFRTIRGIDSRAKFRSVQDALARAAADARVPRVWFDDNWAERV